MRALGFLMILVAIWLIINAINIREVIQGRAKFTFNQSPSSTNSDNGGGASGSF